MDKNLEGFKKERVRFPIVKKQSNVIFDELAFIANKSSTNARKITTLKECIKLNIWYDKHYHDRHHLGENNGDVREGIEPEIVEDLIRRSIKHLFFYSSSTLNFKFINLQKQGCIRVNLRDISFDVPLNVVIEVYYLDVNEFEITVYTAKRVEDFWKKQGRFIVELNGDNSILFRTDNSIFTKLGEF